MKTLPYAVTFTYSFDEDAATYLFEHLDEAEEFLVDSMQKEYNIDKNENEWNSELYISNTKCYAKITTHFRDHDDVTEAHLSNIYN